MGSCRFFPQTWSPTKTTIVWAIRSAQFREPSIAGGWISPFTSKEENAAAIVVNDVVQRNPEGSSSLGCRKWMKMNRTSLPNMEDLACCTHANWKDATSGSCSRFRHLFGIGSTWLYHQNWMVPDSTVDDFWAKHHLCVQILRFSHRNNGIRVAGHTSVWKHGDPSFHGWGSSIPNNWTVSSDNQTGRRKLLVLDGKVIYHRMSMGDFPLPAWRSGIFGVPKNSWLLPKARYLERRRPHHDGLGEIRLPAGSRSFQAWLPGASGPRSIHSFPWLEGFHSFWGQKNSENQQIKKHDS